MINEKNATYFYVGNVANGIADEAAFEGMAAGSIAVVRALDNLNEESAISGTTPVRIVQKKADGRYVFSPVFNYDQIRYKVKQDYVGNTQQVSFWGYDGTSNTTGLGTIVSGSTYVLHVVLNHSRNTYNNAPEIKTVPYKALSTSQADLAKGLQESFIRQFSTLREPNPVIKCERVYSGAQLNALGTATAALTNGSNAVVFSEDMTSLVTAGTILRFGTSGAGTAPCYIVTSHNSGSAAARIYYLDVPYQGTTTATLAAASVESAATGGVWGLKFTGIEQPFSAVQGDELTNYLVAFDLYSEDFGSIVEYKATKPKMGTGTWQEMSYREYYSQFLDKDNIVSTRPRTIFRNEVVEGYGYDVVQINVRASSITSQTTGLTFNSDFTILIATQQTPTDLANDGLTTIFAV